MESKILSFFILINIFCFSQNIKLSVSPIINQEDGNNKKIVYFLQKFLETKNISINSNEYWLKSDFEKFSYPFSDIFFIEKSKLGDNFYQPTLMEIIDTENADVKVVKLAYLGYDITSKSNFIKVIYNVIANFVNEKVYFSNYLNYSTKNWKFLQKENINYYISPEKQIKETEIQQQLKDVKFIENFFESQPVSFNFYSCVSPKEIYQIKGFDYFHKMYSENSGGFVEEKNNVFSGNNSEVYSHEIVHIYTNRMFTNIDPFFNEGIATLLFGSGKHDYNWHKNNFKNFLEKNPDFNIYNNLNVYEELYIDHETPIPYIISAIICEKFIKEKGKIKLFESINNYSDMFYFFQDNNLTEKNINKELRKFLCLKK